MNHDVIASTASTKPMSPQAVALAVLLHGLVALVLWWMAQHAPRLPPTEVPIEVTVEQPPKPPPPPPPVPEKPKPPPAPAPPVRMGIPPPAEITADKPTQVPTRPDQPHDALPPHPDALEKDVPPPTDQVPPPPSTAFATPEHRPEPPRQAQPPPALHGTLPSPPAQKPASPPQPRPEPRRSITMSPQHLPPTASRDTPSPSPFVNPADSYNRARVADNYLWQIVRRLAGYEYFAQVEVEEGTTVVRVVIARNGRLLDVGIASSSGYPQLDKGVVAGIRAGSPYAPLPDSIQGESATFTLPLVSRSHH